MVDLQMSQAAPFLLKISLVDAKCFDFAPQADFDAEVKGRRHP